jgi:hypothetical protein
LLGEGLDTKGHVPPNNSKPMKKLAWAKKQLASNSQKLEEIGVWSQNNSCDLLLCHQKKCAQRLKHPTKKEGDKPTWSLEMRSQNLEILAVIWPCTIERIVHL